MKKKKLTLNQTWTQCLRMWRWIAKVWQTPCYRRYTIHRLKNIWLRKNGFYNHLLGNCFFCDYRSDNSCYESCPGALVDPDFSCGNYDYNYEYSPVEFYKKLLRLNRIRKARKK